VAAAGVRINDARRHVKSARALADDDVTLALAACHDAIRKAITGHMWQRACGRETAMELIASFSTTPATN
jgi:hypothetical protein